MKAQATCIHCDQIFKTPDEIARHKCKRLAQKKRSKYRNLRTPYTSPLWGERTYDSKLEAEYASDLDRRLKGEYITHWMPQPQVPLAGLFYRPDFMVMRENSVEFVDVKGVETQRFRDVRKLWVIHARFPLRIVKRGKTDEVILPKEMR